MFLRIYLNFNPIDEWHHKQIHNDFLNCIIWIDYYFGLEMIWNWILFELFRIFICKTKHNSSTFFFETGHIFSFWWICLSGTNDGQTWHLFWKTDSLCDANRILKFECTRNYTPRTRHRHNGPERDPRDNNLRIYGNTTTSKQTFITTYCQRNKPMSKIISELRKKKIARQNSNHMVDLEFARTASWLGPDIGLLVTDRASAWHQGPWRPMYSAVAS